MPARRSRLRPGEGESPRKEALPAPHPGPGADPRGRPGPRVPGSAAGESGADFLDHARRRHVRARDERRRSERRIPVTREVARPARSRGRRAMNDLLEFVLDAHGGRKGWSEVETLTTQLAVGGPFLIVLRHDLYSPWDALPVGYFLAAPDGFRNRLIRAA